MIRTQSFAPWAGIAAEAEAAAAAAEAAEVAAVAAAASADDAAAAAESAATTAVTAKNTASAAAAAAASAALGADVSGTQIIGRQVDPVTASAVGNNTYVSVLPAANTGNITLFTYFGTAIGTAYIRVFSLSGSTLTMESSTSFTTATGLQDQVVNIPIAAGQYVAFYGNGLIAGGSAYADDLGLWIGSGNVTTSFSVPAINGGIRLQCSWHIEYDVYAGAGIDDVLSPMEAVQVIGRPASETLVTGTATSSTLVFGEPVPRDATLRTVRYYALATGTWWIRVWSRVGDTLTVYNTTAVEATATGEQEATVSIPVPAGCFVGVFAPNILAVNLSTYGDGIGYWSVGSGYVTSFVDTSLFTTTRVQVSFDLYYQSVNTTDTTDVLDDVSAKMDAVLDALSVSGSEYLGIETTPADGSPVTARTYLLHDGLDGGGDANLSAYIDRIEFYANATGSGTFGVWAPNAAGIYFKDNTRQVTLNYVSGLNALVEGTDWTADALPLAAGEKFGFYMDDDLEVISRASSGYYQATGTPDAIAASLITTFELEIRARVRYVAVTGGGDAMPSLDLLPVYTVFLVIGQSNAEGRGTGTQTVAESLMWKDDPGALQTLADPTGNTASAAGSAWPRFAEVFQDRTGMRVVIVNEAVGGTSVISGGWAGSTRRDAAEASWDAALAALDSGGYAYQIGGVICAIGETDADSIDAATATKAQYKAGYESLITWARTLAQMTATTPFIVIETGTLSTGDTTGYQQVREAQREIVREGTAVKLGWTGAKNLAARGLMPDTYHYTQAAYDEDGQANAVLAIAACVGGA